MEISSQNTSNSATIAALQKQVEELSARVGPDLLDSGPATPLPPKKRDTKALQTRLAERGHLLKRIDEAVDQLAEFVMAERALRADLRAIGIPKEFREIMSDEIFLKAVLAKLAEKGVGRDHRFDRSAAKPPLAALADFHPLILNALKG